MTYERCAVAESSKAQLVVRETMNGNQRRRLELGDFLKKNGYGQLWWINWQSIRSRIQWNRVRILIRCLKIKQIFESDELKLGVLDIKYPLYWIVVPEL